MMWSGWFYGAHYIGFIMMVAFWGLIIWGIYSLARSSQQGRREEDRGLQVLRERYARGEISEEEYRARLETLGRSS